MHCWAVIHNSYWVKWHKWHPKFSHTILGFWFRVLSMVGNFHGAVLATWSQLLCILLRIFQLNSHLNRIRQIIKLKTSPKFPAKGISGHMTQSDALVCFKSHIAYLSMLNRYCTVCFETSLNQSEQLTKLKRWDMEVGELSNHRTCKFQRISLVESHFDQK